LNSIDHKKITLLILISLIIFGLLGKFFLISQDEFYYLSRVHDYMNSRLTDPFQNFHVYFFQWVSTLSTNEVDQIKACRIIMFLFFSGTCLFIYLIGKEFSDTTGALFSALCYLSFIFTTINGAGFRSDSIPTFLFLFSLYNFLKKDNPVFFQTLAGLAMAVAVLITIKSAIYLIVFALLISAKLIFDRLSPKNLLVVIVFPLSFVIGFVLLYKFHASAIIPAAADQVKAFSHTAGNSYSTFVSFEKFFPQFDVFKLSLQLDWVVWLCLFIGIIINTFDLFKNHYSFKNAALFILLIPLLSPLFYRNAFPYFYLFITPTATLFCGYAIYKLTSKTQNNTFSFLFVSIISGLIFFNSFNITHKIFAQSSGKPQYQTLNVIHNMFPKPAPYIDGCSMVSSFPKVGFFMSSAGMRGYLRRNKPVMEHLLKTKKPQFLLANAPHLNLNSNTPPRSATGLALLETDWLTLKSNFVHHWGNIWVIGKQIEFTHTFEEQTFKILVPGLYSITSNEGAFINNHLVYNNDNIYLDEGVHIIKARGQDKEVTLKWGANLFKPVEQPLNEELFSGSFM